MPALSDDEPGEHEGIFHPILPDLPPVAVLENAVYDTSPTQSATNSGHVTPTNEPSTPTGSGTSNALSIASPTANTTTRRSEERRVGKECRL